MRIERLIPIFIAALILFVPCKTNAEISVEPMEMDFGEVFIGEEIGIEMTIANDGNEILNILDIDTGVDEFSTDLDLLFHQCECVWEFVQSDINMSCLILEAEFNGGEFTEGSYIGVFTPEGVCGGYSRVTNEWPLGISIWGDERGGNVRGFRDNEEMEFRVWDRELSRECVAEIEIIRGGNRFVDDGFFVCTLQAELEYPPSLEPGELLALNVYFSPSQARDYDGELLITSTDPDDEEVSVSLFGTGIIDAQIRIDPIELEFGDIVISDTTLQTFTIFNDGNHVLEINSIEIDNDCFWSDQVDEVRPGRSAEVIVYFAPSEVLGYEATLTIHSNDRDNEEVSIELFGTGVLRELTVPLQRDWNLISINVTPPQNFWGREEGPDIIRMMEQLRIDEDSHHVLLMKDEDGRFYFPSFAFNNIPYWDLSQGYQVKVDADFEAVWAGEPISAGADIPLERDWNLIAYYPTYELDASAPDYYVLSPIIDHVEIAKDGDGYFMTPEFDFSNMPPWCEGQGYQVKVDEDVVLNYPEDREDFHGFRLEPSSPGSNLRK